MGPLMDLTERFNYPIHSGYSSIISNLFEVCHRRILAFNTQNLNPRLLIQSQQDLLHHHYCPHSLDKAKLGILIIFS